MDTYYIEYSVHDDIFRYCTYITAGSKDEALEVFREIEKDLKDIIRMEVR